MHPKMTPTKISTRFPTCFRHCLPSAYFMQGGSAFFEIHKESHKEAIIKESHSRSPLRIYISTLYFSNTDTVYANTQYSSIAVKVYTFTRRGLPFQRCAGMFAAFAQGSAPETNCASRRAVPVATPPPHQKESLLATI